MSSREKDEREKREREKRKREKSLPHKAGRTGEGWRATGVFGGKIVH